MLVSEQAWTMCFIRIDTPISIRMFFCQGGGLSFIMICFNKVQLLTSDLQLFPIPVYQVPQNDTGSRMKS